MKALFLRRLGCLDCLRALAALWVLAYHANLLIQNPRYFGAPSLGRWAELGHHGVEVFFVLSGFIIATSVRPSTPNDWSGLRDYALRRAFRIFPVYLTVLAPLLVFELVTGFGAPETGTIQSNVARNVLLLPRDDLTTYIPVVAWTLTHELMFYAVFALAFIRRELAIVALLTWIGACAAAYVVGSPQGWAMQLSSLNALFGVGVGLAWLMRDRGVFLAKLPAPKSLRWIGLRSYSLYLVHYPILVAVAMCAHAAGVGPWALSVGVGVSMASASMLHWAVETPGMNLARAIIMRLPSGRDPTPRAYRAAG